MIPNNWVLATLRAGKESAARVTGLSVRATAITGHALNSRGELSDRHTELLNPDAPLTSTVGVPPVVGPHTWKGITDPAVYMADLEVAR